MTVTRPGRESLWLKAGVVVGFAALLGLLMLRHELWRDELQVWLLARDSTGPLDLFRNSRYEGHPILWHALVQPLAHAFADPHWIQVLHWVIAVSGAALLVFSAPFPLWLRTAMVFGYFPLYEYGVLAREYAPSVLGVWAACALAARGRSRISAALGVVWSAWATFLGVLAGFGLGIAVVGAPRPERGRRAAAVLLLAGLSAGVILALPAPDYEHARAWHFGWEASRAAYVVRSYAAALLPLPQWGLHFWGTSALFPQPTWGALGSVGGAVAAAALLIAVLVGVAWMVRRDRSLLLGWVVGAAALLAFAYVKKPGAIRHSGFLWVLLVAVLWLAVTRRVVSRESAALVLAPTIAVSLAASAVAGWWDWRAPFSSAECAASALRHEGLDALPLVGGVDYAASGVAALLPHGRLFYPAQGQVGSYIVWNWRRLRQDTMTPEEMVRDARRQDRGDGFVILVNSPFRDPARLNCREVLQCGGAVVPDESLWGYRCWEPSTGATGPAGDGPREGGNR